MKKISASSKPTSHESFSFNYDLPIQTCSIIVFFLLIIVPHWFQDIVICLSLSFNIVFILFQIPSLLLLLFLLLSVNLSFQVISVIKIYRRVLFTSGVLQLFRWRTCKMGLIPDILRLLWNLSTRKLRLIAFRILQW